MWHALRAGIPFAYALDLPHGALCDLIAVQRIEERGFPPKAAEPDEEADFWRIMGMG